MDGIENQKAFCASEILSKAVSRYGTCAMSLAQVPAGFKRRAAKTFRSR